MDDEERDRIERQALTFFRELYGDQADRTLAAIGDGGSDGELLARINELYETEAARGAEAYAGFWRSIMIAIAYQSLTANGVGADNPALNDDGSGLSPELTGTLERYLLEMARLFGNRYSENSLRLTFEAISIWRDQGGTVGDLREIMRPIWEGPRPITASIQETTRIVVEADGAAWQEAGFWGFNNRTREDGKVRPSHQAVADEGPYPWSMFQEKKPPVNGDYGCRCTISPVVEAPSA